MSEPTDIDYRSYQDNKSGFVSSLLSNNFIPYAKEIGIELVGPRVQDHQINYYSIKCWVNFSDKSKSSIWY